MEDLLCSRCRRRPVKDPRAKFCSPRCRWRSGWDRAVAFADQVEALPAAVLPLDAESLLPTGERRNQTFLQLVLFSRAPAGARGYRVGIRHGLSQIQRWFPIAKRCQVPMFMLDPFDLPSVPVPGMYAVVYLDGRCAPIGGPRFTLAIDQIDRRILYSEGDRTYKPRRR